MTDRIIIQELDNAGDVAAVVTFYYADIMGINAVVANKKREYTLKFATHDYILDTVTTRVVSAPESFTSWLDDIAASLKV